MLLLIGFTVNVSLPFAVPDRDIPNVYVFPLADILEGVELLKEALPPLLDNVKSVVSSEPDPEDVL